MGRAEHHPWGMFWTLHIKEQEHRVAIDQSDWEPAVFIFYESTVVMVYICLAQKVALLEGAALLEWVCHCGHGL